MSRPKKYTDEEICLQIKTVMNALGLDRIPTANEIIDYYDSHALCAVISKYGGFEYFAKMLGCKIKESNASFGRSYEKVALEDIKKETGLEGILTSHKHPYDIYAGSGVKVDVKVSRLKPLDAKRRSLYEIYIGRKEPTCDLYLIYCLDEDEIPFKRLVIPSCILRDKQLIAIGFDSKWDLFDEKWHYFNTYERFYRKMMDETLEGVVAFG